MQLGHSLLDLINEAFILITENVPNVTITVVEIFPVQIYDFHLRNYR